MSPRSSSAARIPSHADRPSAFIVSVRTIRSAHDRGAPCKNGLAPVISSRTSDHGRCVTIPRCRISSNCPIVPFVYRDRTPVRFHGSATPAASTG